MINYGIVLTGGIATGKSTSAKIFKDLGMEVIDADTIGHKVLKENSIEINNLFKENLLDENNEVVRSKLGKIIFGNDKNRERLNSFIHPLIKEEILREASILEQKKKPYLIDIPLFFETNNYDIDKVILVYTTKKRQFKQLIERNNFSKEEAIKRINSQMDIDKKKELSTYIINNIGDENFLKKECLRVFKEIFQ